MKVKAISKHLARWLAVALPLHLYCGFQFAAETRWLKVWSLQAVRQFFQRPHVHFPVKAQIRCQVLEKAR
jgi:hypothetical protein